MSNGKLWGRWMLTLVAVAVMLTPALAQEGDKEMPKKDAPKQEEGKRREGGPLGLPALPALKEKLGLSEEQVGKLEVIYKDGNEKAKELRESAKGGDKDKNREAFKNARTELVDKIKAVLNDEQKKKFEEFAQQRKKPDAKP